MAKGNREVSWQGREQEDMIILERFCYSPNGTFGRAKFGDNFLYSVEPPWIGNMPFKSCIPEGDYIIEKVYSPKFGRDMYEIVNVPDRSHILIHAANLASELAGCIALGTELGISRYEWAVLNSFTAVNEITKYLDKVEHPTIKIIQTKGAIL